MDRHASTIVFKKAEASIPEEEKHPFAIGSWFTLYQGDGRPRSAILCFEPEPKRAKDIERFEVILNKGRACRVLKTPTPLDADGKIFIRIYDIFGDETTVLVTDDREEITMVAARYTRYNLV